VPLIGIINGKFQLEMVLLSGGTSIVCWDPLQDRRHVLFGKGLLRGRDDRAIQAVAMGKGWADGYDRKGLSPVAKQKFVGKPSIFSR